MFRRSSVVEQLTVNQLVVGSTPTVGAKEFKGLAQIALSPFFFWGTAGAQTGFVYLTRLDSL